MITESEYSCKRGRLQIMCQFPNGFDLRCTRTSCGDIIISSNDPTVENYRKLERLLAIPDPETWYTIAAQMRQCKSVQEVLRL